MASKGKAPAPHRKKHKKLAFPHKQLRLVASNPAVDIEVPMGDGPATPTAGYAGWEEVQRIERRAMTSFTGLPAFQQDVPIMLDGWREDRSIERQLEELEKLGGNVVFRAIGPIFRSGSKFVFGDEPEYGEMIRASDESLLRVRMVLKLMEHVTPNLAGHKPRQVRPSMGVPLEYTVHGDEDTLAKIAYALYHDRSKAIVIGRLNKITDVHKKLKLGRKLKLPVFE